MTRFHRPVLRLASAAIALSVAACASPGADPGAVESTSASGAQEDAIAVLTKWSRAVRTGDAETACGLVTPSYADLLVAEAISFGASPTHSCVRAVPTLARVEFAPPPVTDYVVESATADRTVLVLEFENREPQKATLVLSGSGWLVDGVTDVPEPT